MSAKLITQTDKQISLAEKRIKKINEEIEAINRESTNIDIDTVLFTLLNSGLYLSLGLLFSFFHFFLGLIPLGVGAIFLLYSISSLLKNNKLKKRKEMLEIDKLCLEEFGDEAAEYGLLPESTDSE